MSWPSLFKLYEPKDAVFYLSLFFICILLYFHYKSSLVNTFLVLMFSIISEIKDKE